MIIATGVVGYYAYQIHQDFAKVNKFEPIVMRELEANGIPQYKNLAMAIIYTETKGREYDVMQSSESVYGEPGMLTSNEASIKAGIDFLAQAINRSNEAGTDIWTAVQAYNFGLAYIDYIAQNGGIHTVKLAKTYSRKVVAPSLGNTTGKTYTYNHPIAFLYKRQTLYVNGGNFYYAKIVQLNERLFRILG
ncbi:MAG: lysozyme family protein [Streptococcaceae bacterium]|nr:lysozyme family protein [Streptococcaceae bacterium]